MSAETQRLRQQQAVARADETPAELVPESEGAEDVVREPEADRAAPVPTERVRQVLDKARAKARKTRVVKSAAPAKKASQKR